MVAIVEYGVGNLFSLRCSLSALGCEATMAETPQQLLQAKKVILPGVGAFGDAMAKLRSANLVQPLKELAAAGVPVLGICLGMQLLFEGSDEFGSHDGIGLIPGRVCSLQQDLEAAGYSYKVPHMGWNPLQFVQPQSPILQNTNQNEAFYYVHSFYAKHCEQYVVAQSEYGLQVPGVVQNSNVYGTQFHPEKSGDVGLAMLKAFLEVC